MFGDAATATIISSKKDKNSLQILDSKNATDGSKYESFILKNFGAKNFHNVNKNNFIYMNGPEIYDFTLKEVPKFILKYLKTKNLNPNEINHYVCHQANENILLNIKAKLGVSHDNFHIILKKTGNTVSSSIPIVLSKVYKKIKKNETILLIGFGVGLSWNLTLLKKIEKT